MISETRSCCLSIFVFLSLSLALSAAPSYREIVVTNDFTLEPGSQLAARLIVRANHITIDGHGATLLGPGTPKESKSLEDAGTGILVEGTVGVTINDLKVHGFATGLLLRQVQAASVRGCDFSDNYDNPAHGWGELPPRGGILCIEVQTSVFTGNRANRVWDGIHLIQSTDNLVADNDFSHCSNTAAKLWRASRNRFLNNNLSYGLRIDRAAGEVHARDSTGVLIETGSNDNYWYRNDVTHGGDGIFIRPLNRWVSRGNIFVENDTSYANNNCVESWSPGNVFIRNTANHGSYGFWLGGSDQTVLIGNEAAFNGLTNGYHNAPEPGFHHGGIVIVGGPSSHCRIEGNDVHHNNGAGIAFRGDVGSKGAKWQTEHWIIQGNRVSSNRFGVWGRWGANILLAANTVEGNTEGNMLTNVTDLIQLAGVPGVLQAPVVRLRGPEIVSVGETTRFDASGSTDPASSHLNFRWWVDGLAGQERVLERVFERAGFFRVSLTVDNGTLADMAWRDLLVVQAVAQEIGTEGQALAWSFELEGNQNGNGRVRFENDRDALVGSQCLKFTPDPYPGAYATAIYPADRRANWNLAGKKTVRFWIKTQNPNLPGYQNAGPVLRLFGQAGEVELKPVKDGNLLNEPSFSEARWLWMPLEIPLAGSPEWTRRVTGPFDMTRVDALGIGLDSWGWDPFTVWIDGLSFE